MDDERQKPEQILARIKQEELLQSRGKLKIFLGAAAGVGKTYTMLEAAQRLMKEGVDVVAGLVVTHGRKETQALLSGLEIVLPRQVPYKGTQLEEMDLDELLMRKPSVVLVDELAHTNAPGSRHEKRWQDVEELLQAGISVFTTVNIQHLETVNDLVAQITGVKVHETIPDSILENAHEIELVDLPPDELIQRLRDGKIYIPENAKVALENFFKKGNLIALRELALRVAAERVDAQMLKYRQDSLVQDVWPIAERILVCVGPSPLSARLVRAGKRMATSLHAEWIAAAVETPRSAQMSDRDRNRLARNLHLAQRLGAQTAQLSGNAAEELVRFAQTLNVSKIVIGKPARPRWREILFGSVVDDLIRRSGNIDVYVISGNSEAPENETTKYVPKRIDYRSYGLSMLVVALASGIAGIMFPHFSLVNLVMVYLLAVVIIAVRSGKGPSIVSSFLSVAAFDFFFVPPYLTFAVSDTQYLVTFAVMLVVGLMLSTLTSTVKQQVVISRKRERQTAALYRMAREQATALTTKQVVDISQKHISEVSDSSVVVLVANKNRELILISEEQKAFSLDSKELGVAQWVFMNQQPAGVSTATLSGASALYMPLIGSAGAVGVIGLLPKAKEKFQDPDEMHLLETFVNQMALAVERAQLTERVHE